MIRALLCSSSGGLRRNCIYAASGIVTLCRWLPCALVKKELKKFIVNFHILRIQFWVEHWPVKKPHSDHTSKADLDDWLTVHRSITLVDLQLDAQNSYLFTYNILIKIIYMIRALLCSSSGGLPRNCIYAASGIVTLCRWLSCALVKKELKKFILNRCTGQSPAESDVTRDCIYTIRT